MSRVVVPRPRSAAELLNASVQLVRAWYGPLLLLTALLYLPLVIVDLSAFHGAVYAMPAKDRATVPPGFFAGMGISYVWSHLTMNAALIVMVDDMFKGQPVRLASVLARMVRRAPAVLALLILIVGILAIATAITAFFVGIVATLVVRSCLLPRAVASAVTPWIILGVAFCALAYASAALSPAAPIVLLEHALPHAAIKRAAKLTLDLRGHVLLMFAVLYGVYFGVYLGLVSSFTAVAYPRVTWVVAHVYIVAIYPVLVAALVLLYYDLRIRKEGYDVELITRALPAPVEALPA